MALFGASTGAAPLSGRQLGGSPAGQVGDLTRRPAGLAEEALERVRAPTLLIVGGRDVEVLALE